MKWNISELPLNKRLIPCIITLYTGIIYSTNVNPWTRLFMAIVFLPSSITMIIFWTEGIINGIIDIVKLRISTKPVPWEAPPEYYQRARDYGVKLDEQQPFIMLSGIDNAFSNGSSKKVMFGDVLFSRLNKEERLALLGHELTHIKKSHTFWIGLVLLETLLTTGLILSLKGNPGIIIGLTLASLVILLYSALSWFSEFQADEGAVRLAGKIPTINLLQKARPEEKWHKTSSSHPSISRRVKHIQNIK